MKKTLCLIILSGVTMAGCSSSSSTKTSKAERAYYKYLKHTQVARQEKKARSFAHQKNENPLPLQHSTSPPAEQNAGPESVTASNGEQ